MSGGLIIHHRISTETNLAWDVIVLPSEGLVMPIIYRLKDFSYVEKFDKFLMASVSLEQHFAKKIDELETNLNLKESPQ